MSSVADVDRVRSLVSRVQRLGNVQAGDVIHAQRWNDLVGVVMEIAQTLLAPRGDLVPPHEHPDQVKVTWLDPSLRNLIERGSLAIGEGPQKLLELEKRIIELRADVDELKKTAAATQSRLLELSTRDLERDASHTEVQRSVTAILNRGDSTTDLRATLSTVQAKVNEAIAVGSSLRIGTQPVDMNVIDQRLRSIEELRKRMELAGELLDARTIENRIAQVRNDVVTQKQLDEALKQRKTKISDDELKSIRESVTDIVRGDVNAVVGVVKKEILDQADTKLKGVDDLVTARVDTRLQTALDAAIGGVRDDIGKNAAATLEKAVAAAKKNASELTDETRKTLDKRIDDVQSGVSRVVGEEIERVVPQRLSEIEKAVSTAAASASNALQVVQSHATLIQQTQAGVAQLSLQTSRDIAAVRDSTVKELTKRDADIGRVDKRIVELDDNFDTRVDKRLEPRIKLVKEDVSLTVRRNAEAAANAAVANVATSLRAEMKGIARDEAVAVREVSTIKDPKKFDIKERK